MEILSGFDYTVNTLLLSIFGLWPSQNIWRNRFCFTSFAWSTLSLLLVLVTGIYEEEEKNFVIVVESIGTAIYIIAGFSEYAILYKNEYQVKYLYDQIALQYNSLNDEKERKIFRKFLRKGRIITVVYFWYVVIAYITVTSLTYTPSYFISNCSSRFPYYAKFVISYENISHWQIFIHTSVVILYHSCFFICVISAYSIGVQYVCGIFAIACYRLKKSFQNDPKRLRESLRDAKFIYSGLIKMIDKHNEAIEAVYLIDKMFGPGFLVIEVLGLSVFGIGIFDLKYALDKGMVFNVCRLLVIAAGLFGHLFFLNWSGEQILECCGETFMTLYFIKWYKSSIKIRIMLIILYQRCNKINSVTAGYFHNLSLENFTKICRKAFSLCTVLLTMQSIWTEIR